MAKYKKPSNVVVGTQSASHKKLYIIIACVVVVLLLVVAGTVIYTNRKQSVSGVCSNNQALIDTAAAALDPSKIPELAQVVSKIQSISGYESDPNCLYPIVEYYVYTNDASAAKSSLTQLEAVYDPQVGLAPQYSLGFTSIDNLKQQIGFVEKFNADLQNNAIYSN